MLYIASSYDFDQNKNEYIWFESELVFARERLTWHTIPLQA